ncbi:hypothetical protein [Dyadobacter arcticus]|uniref:Uncharacterized protein n=1 Tax=Dyadobacter arcticus TaxID=1078754 RepID=A0ABX0UIY6_9BACT|nr:hypothetical protein [Dyadobacter arcticus]NIJ52886.1 hypothetical protein [Dyadobacter arcticus]
MASIASTERTLRFTGRALPDNQPMCWALQKKVRRICGWVNTNGFTNSPWLLISLVNSNFNFRESELMALLLKLEGQHSLTDRARELIRIPIKN